ncbi:unnamed protein product [Meloidogyne enterolobii]|uniref:Uncharacterized protein n=2 Tax=Meloidogyne enterolobii TaxID=390850 RepID=A0ACB0XZ17_MELEN
MTGYKRLKRGYRPLADRLQEQLDFTAVHSPSDPLYQYQWYLKNDGQSQGKPRLDLNVEKAWALGYTGKNITTAIMDDGVDYMHPDLKLNFNAEASYDFSSNDPYPYPRYTDDWFVCLLLQSNLIIGYTEIGYFVEYPLFNIQLIIRETLYLTDALL